MTPQGWLSRATTARYATAALVVGTALCALTAQAAHAAPPACTSEPSQAALNVPRAAEALAKRNSLTIVAIGSSSTVGVGASSADRTYPALLQAELRERFPGADITVINRGGNGEDVNENLRRFESDVHGAKPDLVLWQLGTNYILRNWGVQNFAAPFANGLDLIRSYGADAVVIDLQYSPWVNGDADTPAMTALLASVAREKKVSVFKRYALMKRWVEVEKVPMSTLITFDGLHLTDWSYACFTRALTASLVAGLKSRPAVASAPAAQTSATSPAQPRTTAPRP